MGRTEQGEKGKRVNGEKEALFFDSQTPRLFIPSFPFDPFRFDPLSSIPFFY